MRRNTNFFGPLATFLTLLILCSTLMLSGRIQPVQAQGSSLPDQAVAFLKTDYQNYGAEHDLSIHYPYVAYILDSAGVTWESWEHNGVALKDAVNTIVDNDINNAAPVKYLAQDLILMQAVGDNTRSSQLETLLQTRQNTDGTFLNDTNAFSIIPAYEVLGRANKLSIVDTVYAQDYILGQTAGSGAWTRDWADVMETAQAVRALNYLAPGAASGSTIGQAITKGCDWLKLQQQTDGSFRTTFDDALIDTAEAIATQKALGLDPASAWTVSGSSAVDYLTNNSLNSDGSFGDSKNVMDAAWALDSFTLLGLSPSGGGGGGPGSSQVNVRVRVEGAASNLADTTVSVSGTALDALNAAVGSGQVVAPGGFVTSIKGESGRTGAAADTDTAWFFYAIRSGSIDPASLNSGAGAYNVQNGDQIIFYIGAYGHTTYAPKTFFPIVSVSPQSPAAAQTVTINISAQKYDWTSGLQDLSSAEAAAIGDYTVTASGASYTSQSGQVNISNLTAGSLNYSITNQNAAGYPNVVPYRDSINVKSGSGGAAPACIPEVKVVGKSGETLFGPANVSISSTSPWGNTVLGALEATGLPFTISSKFPGFVDSIAGQSNSGQEGWMYTVNGAIIMQSAANVTVSSSDKIIWYYSTGFVKTGSVPPVVTTGNGSIDPAIGGTVGQGTDAQVIIPPGALAGSSTVQVGVNMLTTPPPLPHGFTLLGQAYEFTIDNQPGYTFNKPVTLSFTFDPAALLPGQTPSIYYYDTRASKWVELGGTVSENTISVSVDHFTCFAVLVHEAEVLAPVTREFYFGDLNEHWAKTPVETLVKRDAVGGYSDGTFKPDNHITRAEFVSILNKALQLAAYTPSTPDFSDVSSQDWFYPAVENAVHAGIIKGYGQRFNPHQEINREELAAILINALGKNGAASAGMDSKTGFADNEDISDWARGFVLKAVEMNLIKGYPDMSFNPKGKATRAEACVTIVNLLNILQPNQ